MMAHSGVTADAGDVVAQGDVDLGEHRRGRNRGLDLEWVEIRGDKAVKCKAALTNAGGKYQEQIEAALEKVSMVTAPEEKDDDEPRYTAWLDLPISTREPMTAKDANEARKALLALDDRTPQQRLLGEPPTWRSALAQRNR